MKLNYKKHKALITLILLTVALGVGVVLFLSFIRNYAEEVAAPIEKVLVVNGAVKQCSRGDAGRGPDNQEPWHEVFYTVALGEKQAIELANKAANEGGYTLTHASPTNRGHLGVADIYIDDWYYSDKTSTYSDLENGKIELAMTVNAEGDNTTCGNPPLAIDSEHSVIGINVRLPLRR